MKRKTLLAIAMSLPALIGCHGTRPDVVGKGTGPLASCPASPNCVNTRAADSTHAIAPLRYTGNATEAMARLVTVVNGMKRTNIINQTDTYLYAEFTSAFWRFVDDVEFECDTAAQVIHFRSASRLGYSDMGVNRERMEQIRDRFNALAGK